VGPFGLPRKAQQDRRRVTGTVIDRQGRILTADHVVAGATSVSVIFQDGTTPSGEGARRGTPRAMSPCSGFDPSGLKLQPLPLGSVSAMRIGNPLAVIGDPFDFHSQPQSPA
jgi:S1-C subfamily serine protease